MAIATRANLRRSRDSEIFAFHMSEGAATLGVKSIQDLRSVDPDSALVYHASFGIPEVTETIMAWSGPLLLAYHNITPSEMYRRFDEKFASGLEWGRKELAVIRDKVLHAFADSEFNARELRELGYESVSVQALGLDPYRLVDIPSDPRVISRMAERFPSGFVLVVSQVLPHKQMELAIQSVHCLRTVFELDIGLVIVGPHRNPLYYEELQRLVSTLPGLDVDFTGSVSEAELVAYYRSSICLLSTSAHEGYALPPLEAMAEGVCVVARSAGAISETVGSGGLLLPTEVSISEIAGCIHHLLTTPQTTRDLRLAGYQRVAELATITATVQVGDVVENLLL
jgi:glycosyltransferase involved in cell wall biosynthesis